MIDNKFEFRQAEYDWFEDAQDLGVHEAVFARVGDRTMSPDYPSPERDGKTKLDNYFSIFGYVSDGTYVMSPYVDLDVDKKYFEGKYRQLSQKAANELLANSSKTLSIIGTRFKSSNSGVIMNPKYDSINQNVFGTDSIAYSGLSRS